ncbi:MAG: type II toxin-antitoxin system prevent-host-death family antitoxin [Verrucomicrobia bacterium]|nr:type II toxin-antitoxin system prevent-host-death family antitoxin [Verrucomicrobiota bacterium]
MTRLLCHLNLSHVKTASVRELKRETTTVLGWVEAGERVEIQKRGKPVAILSRPEPKAATAKRPDFLARLKSIYGDQQLTVTATELLAEDRGDR